MGLKYLSIFDKRGEKMARKEFETLTPQMFYILLSLYEPICGLEIMEKVNEMTEGDVRVGAGTLYALLPRFENIGYIQLLKEENKRKVYKCKSGNMEHYVLRQAYIKVRGAGLCAGTVQSIVTYASGSSCK